MEMRPGETLKTWSLILLGPILFLALSRALIEGSGVYWGALSSLAWGSPYKSDAMLRAAENPRVVVLGSSAALRDLDEGILAERLSAEVLNLGVNGATVVSAAMWAPEVAVLRPETVLVVVSALELSEEDDPEWREKYHPEMALAIYGPRRILGRPSAHLGGLMGWIHPLYFHRPGLQRLLLEGVPDPTHPRQNEPLVPERMRAQLAGVAGRLGAARLSGRGPDTEALFVMGRLFTDAGVQMVVCPAPVHPGMGFGDFPETLEPLLEALAQAGLKVVPTAALGEYPAKMFADPLHLSPPGQRRFTNAVADAL